MNLFPVAGLSSNAQVTLTNGTTIFTDDAYDGCEVYVEYTAGGVTKNAYVGTLTIRMPL